MGVPNIQEIMDLIKKVLSFKLKKELWSFVKKL
jgi:hypothetical protein